MQSNLNFKPSFVRIRQVSKEIYSFLNRNFKTEILASRYKFHKLLVNMALKRLDGLILPIFLCGSEI